MSDARSYFKFNNQSSLNHFLTIEYRPDAAFAERRGESYQIAGKNGLLFREEGTYGNYEQVFKVFLRDEETSKDVYEMSRNIAAWLIGSSGYCRLEDSYSPDYFRLARFAGPMSVEADLLRYGRTTLVFDCQPQRYLKTGETAVTLFQNVNIANTVLQSVTVANANGFEAKPLLKITGRGQIRIMSEGPNPGTDLMDITLNLGNSDSNFNIDCDSYAVSLPNLVNYNTTYPVLTTLWPGNNTISLTNVWLTNPGYLTKLEIVPRWWTL